MIQKPLVSVIMNCHNGETFLKESLKSLLFQTYSNWELIFWDNLSEDNSKKILNEFSDKRIKYFLSEKFTNLYEARNLAIERAKGKYITFLDTDDLWVKNKLEKQLNFLNENSEFKIFYSNYFIIDEIKKKKYIMHKKLLPSGDITQDLLNNYVLGITSVILEKQIFNKHVFQKNYNVIGDFDFFIKISQIYKIGCIQDPLDYYRVHKNSYSIKRSKIYINELKNWITNNTKQLKERGYNINSQKVFLLKLKIKSFLRNIFNKR